MTKPDFQIGSLSVSPSRRTLAGPSGTTNLQPQVMAVFQCLADELDQLVSRKTLFERCWGNAPVGDDSLNRALSAIRRALEQVGATDVGIETFARSGYRLVSASAEKSTNALAEAIAEANDAWRAGLPKPDTAAIDQLEEAINRSSGPAHAWGMLALLLRKAVEYSDAESCAAFVTRCQDAARRALDLDPGEGNARVAMASLAPVFGHWAEAREALLAVIESDPGHVAARHDLAFLEMSTGRPRAALALIEQLVAEDGFAPAFLYKRMYQAWTVGEMAAAELVAGRALHLWPRHPAIWAARFWTLIFTQRAGHAQQMVDDGANRPDMPEQTADFLKATARIGAAVQAGTASEDAIGAHVERCLHVAAAGPANAVAALFSLCAISAVDAAFDLAHAYYLGQGTMLVPLRTNPSDLPISDQYRRLTQPLFIPATQVMRDDPRFLPLCRSIGLEDYWQRFGFTPDFQQS